MIINWHLSLSKKLFVNISFVLRECNVFLSISMGGHKFFASLKKKRIIKTQHLDQEPQLLEIKKRGGVSFSIFWSLTRRELSIKSSLRRKEEKAIATCAPLPAESTSVRSCAKAAAAASLNIYQLRGPLPNLLTGTPLRGCEKLKLLFSVWHGNST